MKAHGTADARTGAGELSIVESGRLVLGGWCVGARQLVSADGAKKKARGTKPSRVTSVQARAAFRAGGMGTPTHDDVSH